MSPTTPPVERTVRHDPKVRVGFSDNMDPAAAGSELRDRIGRDSTAAILAFASNRYDQELLANSLRREFPGAPIIGCTTGGEIGPCGYRDGGISAVALDPSDFVCEIGLLEGISRLSTREYQAFAYRLRQRLASRVPHFDATQCFALLLIDGLCFREEAVARAISDGLGSISMVGGSAGDGLSFRETAVLYDGHFHTDAAVLLIAATPYPFVTFKSQHFECDERRFVLTGVIPERRTVTEINGCPAAEEYARALGVSPSELTPSVFSAHPMVVKIGGSDFIRSIQKINPDGSLTFFCAIDEGLVIHIGKSVNLAENLQSLFDELEQRLGRARLVIGFDCILRRLEMVESGSLERISNLLKRYNVIGFNSYGEQFRGMHVNQTFTGIAIGAKASLHE
ncbi:MAG TPA: FIST N-terminal domain-containing protein [Candidatus Acidoferrales bacterium]|nr:FIST N-terminal domain-containing protein [Candidatus Acidoferrales bacterium]